MSDILDSFPDVPVKFWVCPDHRGRVEWTGKVATCLECGLTNQSPAVPSTSDEDAHVRFLTNERTTLVARCEELYAALAAARAEIAAQAATITELRAELETAQYVAKKNREHFNTVSEVAEKLEADRESLRAQLAEKDRELAEAQLEATKLATEGVWDYEYGMNALVTGHFIAYNSEGEARAWVAVHEQPLMRRRRWRGPVQAVEETTE